MAKVTFTFDDETVAKLRAAARDLDKAQSLVVREAVAEYHARHGAMSTSERLRKLAIFDSIMRRPGEAAGTAAKEIRAVRTARRQGGRRTRVE